MNIKIDPDILDRLRAGDIIIRDNERYKIHAMTDLAVMAMNVEASELKMLPILSLVTDNWFIEKNEECQSSNLKFPLRSSL